LEKQRNGLNDWHLIVCWLIGVALLFVGMYELSNYLQEFTEELPLFEILALMVVGAIMIDSVQQSP
jgi:uncharacterized membrane protein